MTIEADIPKVASAKPLDERQRRVVKAGPSERLLVLAGPGSGKTEVSARRIAYLLGTGLRPADVLVLSFSRSAVKTLMSRLESLADIDETVSEELRHLSVRTFDSWTFRMLRNLGREPSALLRRRHDDSIADLVNELSTGSGGQLTERLTHIRHVLVDEMQDLAGVRGDLVAELLNKVAPPGGGGAGFTLLGDSAQSIYGFSVRNSQYACKHGSTTAELLTGLRKTYARDLVEVGLDRNYRSSNRLDKRISALRNALVASTKTPAEKLSSAVEILNRFPEAEFQLGPSILRNPPQGSIALLARTNGGVLRIAQKLFGTDEAGPGVPFRVGKRDESLAPAWVAGILGRVRASVVSKTQFLQIFDRARAAAPIGSAAMSAPPAEVAWSLLAQAATGSADSMSLEMAELSRRIGWPGALPDDHDEAEALLSISTIHQSKGREFDDVAILEHEAQTDESCASDEEASVIFVAISRAGRSVTRLPGSSVFALPTSWPMDAAKKRHRLSWWRNGWVNLEMGLAGDVCASSFADSSVHGSDDAVEANFRFLAENATALAGHKVVLVKTLVSAGEPKRYQYMIHLQDQGQPGRLLGAMDQVLVKDLLRVLRDGGWMLPGWIMNLRISRVVTLHDEIRDGVSIPKPFEQSGLWLGVELFGTGDFMPKRYGGTN